MFHALFLAFGATFGVVFALAMLPHLHIILRALVWTFLSFIALIVVGGFALYIAYS